MWKRDSPLEQLWQPIFATKSPLIVHIPVMENSAGTVTEWVGMGPLSRTAELLGRHHYPYRVCYGTELTFSQLQEEPSLMLGGFQGVMATRMLQKCSLRPGIRQRKQGIEQSLIPKPESYERRFGSVPIHMSMWITEF
jgi:hypothetical protein